MKNNKKTFANIVRFLIKNKKAIKMYAQADKITTKLMHADRSISGIDPLGETYSYRVNEFDQAMADLSKAKWHAAQAMLNSSGPEWKGSFECLNKSMRIADALLKKLHSGEKTPVDYLKSEIGLCGTEIPHADGIPLVPEINPVVILKGSDFDMGYQYARQVIDIFGKWVFDKIARKTYTQEEFSVIKEWEKQLLTYAPEIPEMCKGWVAGAADCGISLEYYNVLEVWTGHTPPTRFYMGFSDELPERLSLPACSGAAAWGRATKDGRLVTGSSGDHDCGFMVTIVAFPKTGNSFIYTPFSVNGELRMIGDVYMMGHPGMNNKGVAYVEHGGESRIIEPKKYWGYGIRKGASVFHTLRFANSAVEAREMELSYPVGDAGRSLGTAGGFYADSTYGYVLESRKDPVIVREAGVLGETDFLYANNSAMHPDACAAGWMQSERDNWVWDDHGGWHPLKFSPFTLSKALKKEHAEERAKKALSYMYNNSYQRGIYLYDVLNRSAGQIDLEYMKMIYRKSGTIPPGPWKKAVRNFKKYAKWGEYSVGHSSNALVTVMKPDNGSEGIYSLCVGTAARGLATINPTRSSPIYGETNAFWEIKLASGPAEAVKYAGQMAVKYIRDAKKAIAGSEDKGPAYRFIYAFIEKAEAELSAGRENEDTAALIDTNEQIYCFSKALRAYTRSQVRALQAYQSVMPPKSV